MYYIYQIISDVGETYIGCTSDLKSRWSHHKSRARTGKWAGSKLYNAMRASDPEGKFEDWTIVELFRFESEEEAFESEKYLIQHLYPELNSDFAETSETKKESIKKAQKLSHGKGAKVVAKKYSQPITLKNKNTGEVRSFLSHNEAARVLDLNSGNVSKVARGKQNHTGGWTLA